MHYLSVLGCNFEKLLPDLKPASSTLLKCKVLCKPKMPYLDILKLKFEKTIVIFEISILQFLKIQIYMQNEINFKYGTKNALFGYFGAVISTLEFVKNKF